jgi:hypothetical protein
MLKKKYKSGSDTVQVRFYHSEIDALQCMVMREKVRADDYKLLTSIQKMAYHRLLDGIDNKLRSAKNNNVARCKGKRYGSAMHEMRENIGVSMEHKRKDV